MLGSPDPRSHRGGDPSERYRRPEGGMNSAALLPCLIVAQERPDLLARFAERLSTVMPVVLDRRREVRRRRTAPIAIEPGRADPVAIFAADWRWRADPLGFGRR